MVKCEVDSRYFDLGRAMSSFESRRLSFGYPVMSLPTDEDVLTPGAFLSRCGNCAISAVPKAGKQGGELRQSKSGGEVKHDDKSGSQSSSR